jgi:hypothetical protein
MLYKFYSTKHGNTQHDAAVELNSHKTLDKRATRTALAKKESVLTLADYGDIAELTTKMNYDLADTDEKHVARAARAINFDGTYTSHYSSLSNKTNNLKLNQSRNSLTTLTTGGYDVTGDFPLILQTENDKNEKKSLIDIIKNNPYCVNNIIVLDRGYVSKQVFDELHNNNNDYVVRFKKGINTEKDNNGTKYYKATKHNSKIIKYVVEHSNNGQINNNNNNKINNKNNTNQNNCIDDDKEDDFDQDEYFAAQPRRLK